MKENLLKIYEYLDENDVTPKKIKSKYGMWLGEVKELFYPFCAAPDDVPENYDYAEEIELTNQVFDIFGFARIDDEDIANIRNGEGYVLRHFLFKVCVNTGLSKTYYISFSVMRLGDDFAYIHCDNVDLEMTYREMIINSRYFDKETTNEIDKFHFSEFSKFLETVWQQLQTEENKETASDEEMFDELVRLLNYDNYLNEKEVAELKTDWKNINHNRRAFIEKLVDESIFWQEEDLEYLDDYQKDYLLYWAFTEKFDVFKDDWKFGVKELCQFISKKIGEPFKMTFKEVGNDWELVREKLEIHTEYTLLDLASGNDDCNFIVARKDDKYAIYTLAEQVGLWVE